MRILSDSVPNLNTGAMRASILNYLQIIVTYNIPMSELRETQTPLLRINAIMKQDQSRKISLVTNPRTSVAKLKRQIQQEFSELHSITVLVSVIEDSRGFVLSNNSSIGEHVRHGETVYVQVHRQKVGNDMNLPNNATDLFMTLRYVCNSVIKKLHNLQATLQPLEVVPEVIHLGFWYSNAETVGMLCKLLNKIFTPQSLENYYRNAHDMQNILLLKLINFWFSQVGNSLSGFPQVGQELLALLYKLSLCSGYAQLLKTHKVMKNIIQVSKDGMLPQQIKKMALMVIRNVTGKGVGTGMGTKTTSAYIPTALGESAVYLSNIEDVLDGLCTNSQDAKRQALDQLAENPKLIAEACVRFDYFTKLMFVFTIKTIKDKSAARIFGVVLREIISNTSKQKAKEIMQKDIIRKLHNFLLQSHPDTHHPTFQFYSMIAKESVSKGVFNIEQANQFLASPYLDFQKITIDALSEMSERDKQISPIRFLPSIKDYIRLCLKTENELLATSTLRVISNLTLDEQCRYQINNLKGIEIFIKFLQTGQKHGNSQLQRICAKGLMNLSLASRQVKAKILSLMPNILDRFYKGSLDAVAGSYIENLLKSAKV